MEICVKWVKKMCAPLLLLMHILFQLLLYAYPSVSSLTNKIGSKHQTNDIVDPGICMQEATCKPIRNATCFGTPLPYFYTSVALAEDSVSQFEVQDNLALWQGLRSVPRCWAVVQPLLCAVYMPKCENNSVYLPSQEMCRITRGPCKSVEVKHSWPSFLRCENKKLFPSRCRNPLQEVKFNTTYKCVPPLVETDNPDNWYYEVEGCGLQCHNPLFTEEEYENAHTFIKVLAAICFGATLFTVITFAISWKAANRYPGVIIFYINMCLAIASFGWLIQFFPGAREEIVCLHDGTVRRHQPRSGEHLCSITFVLIYSFLMAAIVWFVILTYAWHVLFTHTGTPKDTVRKKVAYFHLSAWSIPLVLTTTIMAMKEVDGDSLSGICFVGYSNRNMRVAFVLVPIAIAALIGGFFLARVLYTLIKVKLKSEEVANMQVKKKIHRMIFRIGIFSTFALFFIICTFACHAYDFTNLKVWEESLREYITCQALNSVHTTSVMGDFTATKCVLKSRPSTAVVYLHLFCLFGFGIIMSLWVWTRATVESWKRFFYGICEPSEKNALAMKRHQLIAKAFQKRHEINQGHFSLSLNSTHEDPVGMNLEVNSVVSRDISSSWAAALPQFLMRRNAIAGIQSFVPRHYSSASDVSRHISVDSFNQQNLDSLSMQISEQEFVAQALRHQRRKTRKERERFLRANRIAPWFPGNRRGSDTSLQSSLMAASIVAAAAKNANMEATVTKSTSTGDLPTEPDITGCDILPSMIMPNPSNRPHIQRQTINPPFTHGMTDNSHRLDGRGLSSALGASSIHPRFTPNPAGLQNSFMGMMQTPMYGQSYDILNALPYGYGGMYPPLNGMFSTYPPAGDFGYPPYNALSYPQFGPYQNNDSTLNPYQQNIIPLLPRVESASDAEFFPIVLSESEATDTGHRSYDESQYYQRLVPVQAPTQPLSSHSEMCHPKPGLEPQACAKTQFLKRMGSFSCQNKTAVPQLSRPPSGRKSPHSEAPPPSPAESTKSLHQAEGSDVLGSLNKDKTSSSISLPHTADKLGIFQKIESKLRRSRSLLQNCQSLEPIEVSQKPFSSSHGELSKPKVMENSTASQVNGKKEKCLDPTEGVSLLQSTDINENISR